MFRGSLPDIRLTVGAEATLAGADTDDPGTMNWWGQATLSVWPCEPCARKHLPDYADCLAQANLLPLLRGAADPCYMIRSWRCDDLSERAISWASRRDVASRAVFPASERSFHALSALSAAGAPTGGRIISSTSSGFV